MNSDETKYRPIWVRKGQPQRWGTALWMFLIAFLASVWWYSLQSDQRALQMEPEFVPICADPGAYPRYASHTPLRTVQSTMLDSVMTYDVTIRYVVTPTRHFYQLYTQYEGRFLVSQPMTSWQETCIVAWRLLHARHT